ncbi:MAG TPA: integrin alpha, partial [Candidatus Udaeobacter sp.]|nr:integrin alpha [Candidatus Udaeobacter sp.]
MSARTRVQLAALAVALLATLILVTLRSRPELVTHEGATAGVGPRMTAGVDAGWWQSVTGRLASDEYHASMGTGGLQAPNRAHNLRTRFGPEGIAIEPRILGEINRQFGWETVALGRPGRMVAAAPVTPAGHGSRVSYERPGWSEWYENTPEGLEQGFTLERRPSGEGPLRIAGTLAPGLTPELVSGEVDFCDAQGARVLHYGKLVTLDAAGRTVPSRMVLAGRSLVLEVDDRDAVYPLIVDPLMTSPAWSAESNQAGANFGESVATAGDVNGDGYDD